MRLLFIPLLPLFLFFYLTSCKEVQKRETPSGVNIMIHDIACQEVKDQLIRECKNQGFPFDWQEKDQGILLVGPLSTRPLSDDAFVKMEEKFKLEIKCLDPLSTRISVQIQLRGLTSDNQWKEIKDPDHLNAYGNLFIDRLIKP